MATGTCPICACTMRTLQATWSSHEGYWCNRCASIVTWDAAAGRLRLVTPEFMQSLAQDTELLARNTQVLERSFIAP